MTEAGDACGLAYTFSAAIAEDGRVIDGGAAEGPAYRGFVLPDLLLNNLIANGSSPLLRRSAMLEAGGYDPGLRAQGAEGCEDLKLYLAIAESHAFGVVPLPLTGYRVTSVSMSSDVARMIRSHRLVTEPYRPSHPDQVRLGRVHLALHCAGREKAAGNHAGWLRAMREAARSDLGATARAMARTSLRRVASPAAGGEARSVERPPFPAARAEGVWATHGDPAD